MRTEELESLLASAPVEEVMAAIDDPERAVEAGWNLHGWTYCLAASSVCLLHADESGKPQDMLVVVRAPRDRRERLARLVADFPLPAKLVLID